MTLIRIRTVLIGDDYLTNADPGKKHEISRTDYKQMCF
jgi:hypothetical protein